MRPDMPKRVRRLQMGVTALELAIVTTIVATIAVAAASDLAGFLVNSQLRTASDELRSALRLAQIEAIKRQAVVELVLTAEASGRPDVQPASDGRNWVIRAVRADGGFELLQASSGAALAPRVRVEADREAFAFDAFGRLRADSLGNAAPEAELRIELSDRDALARSLRVVVRPSGSSLNCDPHARGGDAFACG